jgi:hypothetical protein
MIMKRFVPNRPRRSVLVLAFSAFLAIIFPSQGEELPQADPRPLPGTFWLLSSRIHSRQSPPLPFDPYAGALPVYELNGLPRQYIVADSPEAFEQLLAARALLPTSDLAQTGNAAGSSMLFTNPPEELLFDTMSSGPTGVLPSWRDVRTSPAPVGMALGIVVSTNCPFELTRIEAEVLLENPENLPDTEFEVGFFRNTNELAIGMYADPDYIASDVNATLSKTLTDLGNGRWLLSLELPTYGWGTNRVLTIRTVPNSTGSMTKLSLISSSSTVPGATAYASDNTTTNMTQVALPKMRVWRRMISARRAPSFEWSSETAESVLGWLPGHQIGISTNLASPFDWRVDNNWGAIVDTSEGMGFFIARPDPN